MAGEPRAFDPVANTNLCQTTGPWRSNLTRCSRACFGYGDKAYTSSVCTTLGVVTGRADAQEPSGEASVVVSEDMAGF